MQLIAGHGPSASAELLLEEQEFEELVASGAQAQVLGSGYGFSEGPAADAEGNVYFSDGRNDSIYVWRPDRGVELFVADSTDANGMMFNHAGELLVCEGAAYRIVAFDIESKQKRILVGAGARQFNEPNDLVIDEVGGIYFSDPNYRHRGQETIKKEMVYYVAPNGSVTVVSEVCRRPNGVLLSADSKTLWVADNAERVIYRHRVLAPGKLAEAERWLELEAHPDGMTLDSLGNLYIACGRAGVLIYSPGGKKLGMIDQRFGVPYASNCCFGGPEFRTLCITSRDKFLGVPMRVKGHLPWPARK